MHSSPLKLVMMMAIFMSNGVVMGKDTAEIQLPAPKMDGGMPLMKALKERKSSRDFKTKEIPAQLLSNLLWAAFGINRPDVGKRTAPSAMDWQETQIYAVLPQGVFLYKAKEQKLTQVLKGDVRAQLGAQSFVKEVPLNLIYVTDFAKISGEDGLSKEYFAGADTGFIAQNVYLCAASEGLGAVMRGSVDRDKIGALLKLPAKQKVTFVQSVGYIK